MTETEIRDCYYVMRAMHDGACPNCGHIATPKEFETRDFSLVCPDCYFKISNVELKGIKKITAEAVKRRVESFERSRGDLTKIATGEWPYGTNIN